jgi:hypothetical protein
MIDLGVGEGGEEQRADVVVAASCEDLYFTRKTGLVLHDQQYEVVIGGTDQADGV